MLDWLKNIFSSAPTVSVAPDRPIDESATHKNHGDACLDQGDWQEAISHYQKAIAVSPQYAEAHGNLGFALAQQLRFSEAEQHVKIAVSVKPNLFNSFYILGTISHQLGRIDDAIAHLKQAIAIKPDFADAHYYLGNLYSEQGNRQEAFDAYQRVLAFDPQMAAAFYNIAGLLEFQGNRREAISYYRQALQVAPEFHAARLNLLHQLMQTCDWNGLEEAIHTVRRIVREMPATAENRDSPFAFLALSGTTAEEQKRCAEKWAYGMYQAQYRIRETLGFSFEREPNDKPHIGYLSADFCDHATARLMARVFELHDHSRFKITAYSYGPDDGSKMSERLKASFDRFVDIRGESELESALRIYRDRVDILVDLKGYTGASRSAILALRPAPIQVNYLGYPGTMGADFVDYLIADRFVIPEASQSHYTEKIVYLPDAYKPNDRTRPLAANPGRGNVGLPENGMVFCCFNQTFKITPEIFNVWCELLKRVSGSVLWLIASNAYTEENLQREATHRGVDSARLIFAPRVSAEDHLARQQCADLFLDTIPYNAHTTCSDALWMGLPVITIAGETFSARVAGSLLSAMGVPELITDTLDQYFLHALDLATDAAKRNALHAKIIANRESAPLFDSLLFTRNLEAAYQGMLDEHK
ncbi:MAG TPA: tetratricopeptide repeat protein [Burkholderiaceae bacterium]|nr:tetratricopeptide repeat protein [Burkholderiaceae bacterium]